MFIGLAHDISQDIQPSPVCHTDHEFFHTQLSTFVDYGIKCGDGSLAAFQRKALLTDVFLVQKLFKYNCLVQFFQNTALFIVRKVDMILTFFNSAAPPLFSSGSMM